MSHSTAMNGFEQTFAPDIDDALSLEITIDIAPAVSSETADQVAVTATTVAAAETTVEVAAAEKKHLPKEDVFFNQNCIFLLK